MTEETERQASQVPRRRVFVKTLARKWRPVLLFVTAVVLSSYVGLELVSETYESETSLALDIESVAGEEPDILALESFGFEVKILESRNLLEQVVVKMGPEKVMAALEPIPSTANGLERAMSTLSRTLRVWLDFEKEKPVRERAIAHLADALEVRTDEASSLVTVTLRLKNPAAAVPTLDAIVDAYLDTRTEVRSGDLSVAALREQLARRKAQVALLDQAEAQLRGDADGQDIDTERALIAARLHEVEAGLDDNHSEIARLDAERAEMVARVDTLPQEFQSAEVFVENPVRQTLQQQATELRLEREALLKRYKPGSPPVKNLDERIVSLEALIEEASATQKASVTHEVHPARRAFLERLEGLEVEAAGIEAESLRLARTREELKRSLENLSAIDSDLETIALERRIARQGQEILERRRQGLELASELGGTRIAAVTVVSPPSVPIEPVSPNKTAVLLTALMLATFFGLSGAVWLEWHYGIVSKPDDVRSIEQLDYIGSFELSPETAERLGHKHD